MKLPEKLNEFMSDGSRFQLATPYEKTWKSCWKRVTRIGDSTFLECEGGVTETSQNTHSALIRVTVTPIDVAGAEDLSAESIVVWLKEFSNSDLAESAVHNMRKKWSES
jgi:hypothetical protein